MGRAVEYRIGGLVLQANRQLLDDAGKRVPLGSKALALLSVLAEAGGQLVTKDELMQAAWGDITVEENAIQVHVAALRKALGAAADHLVTIRGQGYRLDAVPAEPESGEAAVIVPLPASPVPPVRAVVTGAAQPVLAVLPFDNLSSDPELAFFCDGVSEEILTWVTRHSALSAIGRTSSFQFRGSGKAQAALQLGATHVLDGSIQRAGGRIRISAHLLDCASQINVWSERFDRGLEDIFAVQDEISEAIAAALELEFTAHKIAPVDPAIYDLYLRAKERVTSPELMKRNIISLEQVVRRAPAFAPGRATLAYRRAELLMHSPYEQRAALAAQVTQDIAVCEELDPGQPDALAARWAVMPPFGSLSEQEAMLNSNAVTNRDFVDFLTVRAYFLECAGRSHEAVEEARRAAQLDSLNPFAKGLHSQALWFAGHYDEARAAMEWVRQKWPDSHHTVAVLIQACVHQRDWDAVARLTDPARLAHYPLREHSGVIAFARVMHDDAPQGRRLMFDTIAKRADATGHIDPQVGVVAAELGFVDETFDLLARCRFGPKGDRRDVMGTHAYRTLLLFPKAYPALRANPRFVQVCARLGLVDYWLATEHWPDCAADVAYDFKAECERFRGYPKDVYFA